MKSAFIAYAKGTREDSQADLTVIPNHVCQLPTPPPLLILREPSRSLARLSSPDARVAGDTSARFLTSDAADPPSPPPKKSEKTKRRLASTQQQTAVPPPPTPSPLCFRHYSATREEISHWFPHSPPAFASLRLPVARLSEGDLISHIRTSIFLKRAKENCFDPFSHERESPET